MIKRIHVDDISIYIYIGTSGAYSKHEAFRTDGPRGICLFSMGAEASANEQCILVSARQEADQNIAAGGWIAVFRLLG